jgi:tryptophanyl-tRNA synthetase
LPQIWGAIKIAMKGVRFFSGAAAAVPKKKMAFSGIQPTGALHLGNYLGALKQWVLNQDNFDNLYCVVDLHAITNMALLQNRNQLRKESFETAAIYLAAGIDPEKSKIFIQSHVPAHTELAWLFNCVTPLNWVERMSQYKDKSAAANASKGAVEDPTFSTGSGVSVGLLTYPILMACDVLLYQPHFVPVGDDQKQHLNLIRDIATRFNSLYKVKYFRHLPEGLMVDNVSMHDSNSGNSSRRVLGSRVMSLQDGRSKMSKSDLNDGSRINLMDSPDLLRKKIKRCKTDILVGLDITPPADWDPAQGVYRPEATNLLSIYASLSGQTLEQVQAEFLTSNWATFKAQMADLVIAYLAPFQGRYTDLMENPDYIEAVLHAGQAHANAIANKSIYDMKQIMGLYQPNSAKTFFISK